VQLHPGLEALRPRATATGGGAASLLEAVEVGMLAGSVFQNLCQPGWSPTQLQLFRQVVQVAIRVRLRPAIPCAPTNQRARRGRGSRAAAAVIVVVRLQDLALEASGRRKDVFAERSAVGVVYYLLFFAMG